MSSFAEKLDLASLKTNVNKLRIDKLKNVPSNLSNFKSKIKKIRYWYVSTCSCWFKWTDVVKNNVVTKDLYNAKFKNVGVKIPDITN